MESFNQLINKKKIIFFIRNNYPFILLFLALSIVITFYDIKYENTNLIFPFSLTTLISFIITFIGIPKLEKIKIKQIIREEGPKSHLSKQGTPTMGGVLFIPISLLISNILYLNKDNYNIILSLSLLIALFMLIGLSDDLLSLKKKLNTGLTSNQKIILQSIVSFIFIYSCNNYISNSIYIANQLINIGFLIYPLALFVLLAESNSANLTDGLDGLLSGCSAIIFTGLAIDILIKNQGNNQSLAQLCIVMAGACMGFLFFNKYPAKVFMGDSGSLAIGASLAGIALISNNLWSLLIMGGLLATESISVIIQVCIFKISKFFKGEGYKLFLMTPIHHHFELKGNSETLIVNSFWFITLLLAIINVIFFH